MEKGLPEALEIDPAEAYLQRLRKTVKGAAAAIDHETLVVWLNLWRTFAAMESSAAARVAAGGLTPAGLNVLGLLVANKPQGLALCELSRQLVVSRANVTGLVDHLVSKGYVRRVDHASDRRIYLAQITPEGESWLRGYLPGHLRFVERAMKPFKPAEKRKLLRFMTRLRLSLSTGLVCALCVLPARPSHAQSPSANASEPSSLSHQQAVTLAIQNHLTTLLSRAETEEARAQAIQAASKLLPQVLGTASQVRVFKENLAATGFKSGGDIPLLLGPYDVFDARLSLVQSLLDLNSFWHRRASRFRVSLAEQEENLAREQVASAASLAYIEARRAARAVEAAQANLDLAQSLLHLTLDQHESGLSTGVDVARSRTRLAQEQVRLIRAQVAARQGMIRLERIVGLPVGPSLKLADDLPEKPVEVLPAEKAVGQALSGRWEIRMAQDAWRADELDLDASRANHLPTLQGLADYGFSGNYPPGSARTGSIGARLSLPIFSGGQTEGEVRSAKAHRDASKERLDDWRKQVEADVRLARETLEAVEEEVKATQSEVALAERELQMARDRFAAGVGDNIQLLSAQTALEEAREARVNSLAGYNSARVNLAMALGTAQAFQL